MQEYFLCVQWILCEKSLTQRRKGRGVCPYMRKSSTQKSQKTTEFCSACLCESLRRLRETITLRKDSVSSVSSV